MRQKIIDGLNELLELDHDAVFDAMMTEHTLSPHSDLNFRPCSYGAAGVRVVSAFSILNELLYDDPITAVIEDSVIQRFE
jgi:hypothetical protein